MNHIAHKTRNRNDYVNSIAGSVVVMWFNQFPMIYSSFMADSYNSYQWLLLNSHCNFINLPLTQYNFNMGHRINLQIYVGHFKFTERLGVVSYHCNVLSKCILLETTSIWVCHCFVHYCLVGLFPNSYKTIFFLHIIINYTKKHDELNWIGMNQAL